MESGPKGEHAATGGAEWRRGWPLVAAAMIGIGTGPGLFQNLSSLFTTGMVDEFGWSRGEIATAAGIGLLGGVAVPFLGRLADRIGVRPVIIGAMLLLGFAYIGLAAIGGEIWQYQLLILCLALSVPGTSALVYGKLIGAAFVAHRGLALGIATSGISITTLVLPPIIGAVIAAYGWRGGFVALGVLTAAIALPLVLFALRGRAAAPTRPDPEEAAATHPVEGLTGAEARRDGRFWRLAMTALLINLATIGLVTQLVPFGLDRGLSAGQAALLLASFGASQVVGRLAIGFLVDRFRPQWMAAGAAMISSFAFLALQVEQPGFAFVMFAVFAAGLMNGAEHDLMPFFGVRLFGLRAFGEVYGTLLMIALIGTASGIVGFGRLHDATGTYSIALAIGTAALALAAVLFLSLRDRPLPHVQAAAHPA
jgi:predicted MFS family arabinose efflux permease